MTARMLIISDTHVPKKARALQQQVWTLIEQADIVLHAGDWVEESLLDAIDSRASTLVGVAGNNDGPALWERLGEVARVEIEGVQFALIHETGSADGRERRCDARFGPASAEPADVLVFGHSHIPWDSTTPGGLRLLNPGSPTDRRRQPVGTVITATVDAGALSDVTFVPTPR